MRKVVAAKVISQIQQKSSSEFRGQQEDLAKVIYWNLRGLGNKDCSLVVKKVIRSARALHALLNEPKLSKWLKQFEESDSFNEFA